MRKIGPPKQELQFKSDFKGSHPFGGSLFHADWKLFFDQKYLKRTKSDNRSSSVPLYPFQSYATIKAIMIDRRYSPCRFPFPILPLRISPCRGFLRLPDAVLVPSPQDKVAPEQYHATAVFPEYFKIGGQWLLAEESLYGLCRSL